MTREEAFRQLVARVQTCRLCPRMEGRARVLGAANGSIGAKVLFVAEAPGRLGADRWHVPLFGDQTGRAFEELLREARLERESVFITNAVLCNPRDGGGRNAPPTLSELSNCSGHLEATIAIVQPQYVIALGAVALRALRHVAAHDLVLSRDVGCPHHWHGRVLVPLYHPGPRARLHRPMQSQIEDFRRLGAIVSR